MNIQEFLNFRKYCLICRNLLRIDFFDFGQKLDHSWKNDRCNVIGTDCSFFLDQNSRIQIIPVTNIFNIKNFHCIIENYCNICLHYRYSSDIIIYHLTNYIGYAEFNVDEKIYLNSRYKFSAIYNKYPTETTIIVPNNYTEQLSLLNQPAKISLVSTQGKELEEYLKHIDIVMAFD